MQEALGLKGGGWTSFNGGVGVAPAPAPFEWGPHQSHPFLDSRIHPFIQQLILTEQTHSLASGWAPATLVRPLMASASPGWGPGGCFCPGCPVGPRALEQRAPALQRRQAGVGCEGQACFALLWSAAPFESEAWGGGPEPALLQGSAAGPSQGQPAPPAPSPPRLSHSRVLMAVLGSQP